MTLYVKVTDDKYELPIAVADSAGELAKMLGVKKNTVLTKISHGKQGIRTTYHRVEVEDDERRDKENY